MLTLNKEMKGDLCVNGVPVRENELHEPEIKIELVIVSYANYLGPECHISASCPVCNKLLDSIHFPYTSEVKRTYNTQFLVTKLPNYCPNCGARLKENIND